MKKFTQALLLINVVTFSWLMIGARMDLPAWQKAFDDAKSAVDNLEQTSDMAATNQVVLHSKIKTAESWVRITIHEYRRSDAALGILTVINIFGLAAIANMNRKNPNISTHPTESCNDRVDFMLPFPRSMGYSL